MDNTTTYETRIFILPPILMGCLLGTILTPVLAAPSAETLVDSRSITPNLCLFKIAAVVILPVLLINAIVSTLRSTRFSVLQAVLTMIHLE